MTTSRQTDPDNSATLEAPGAAPGAGAARRDDPLRRTLWWVTVAWCFGAFWLWTVAGATLTRFAKSLGMSDASFGVLAMLPYVGTLFQLPSSYLLERFGHRKAMFFVTGCTGRLLWCVAAAIPWVVPETSAHFRAPLMVLVLMLAWGLGNMGTTAWVGWMADVIPRRVRGRYFSFRSRTGQMVGLATTVCIGYVLDTTDALGADHPGLMLKVTSALLAVAGVVGALDILCFRPVPDPVVAPRVTHASWVSSLREPLRNAHFRRFLLFNFTLNLAIGYVGQYVWLYLLDVVFVGSPTANRDANFLLIAVPLVIQMISYTAWGRVIDRVGKKPVLLTCGSLFACGTLGWVFITPETVWVGYLITMLSPLVWGGIDIANFNLILDLAGPHGTSRPGESRPQADASRRASGSAYVAMNSIAVALGGILSGLIGGSIAGLLEHTTIHVPLVDHTLTYHGVLFTLSAALRVAAVLFAMGLHEPRASTTRLTMAYMTSEIWSNVRDTASLPSRLANQVFRWTYRLGPRR